ncbi:MAG: hypothetical protein UR26_C0006G0033 [candidate division TM6 bacterium GW2011_GWF2_32_72]|nr:MAG: hypothetical protein UR26_C0006G0033 [candidate division TM6 bacterium GW2011_GWF2_32_72]
MNQKTPFFFTLILCLISTTIFTSVEFETILPITIPGLNIPVELGIMGEVNMATIGLYVDATILKPNSIEPFSNIPELNNIPYLNKISIAKMRLRANTDLMKTLINAKKFPLGCEFEILGEITILNKPVECSLRIILNQKQKIQNLILYTNLPTEIELAELAPDLKGTQVDNLKIKNLGIIIAMDKFTQNFPDLNLNIPFQQGISLFGTIESLNLKTLIEADLPKELNSLNGKNVLFMVRNFNFPIENTKKNQSKTTNTSFDIYGTSKIMEIDTLSHFTFTNTKEKKESKNKFTVEYEGITDLKNIKPFDYIPNLKNLKAAVPDDFKNIELQSIGFGMSLSAAEKMLYITGVTQLYNIQQRVSFFTVVNESGKSGVIIQSQLNMNNPSLADMLKTLSKPIKEEIPQIPNILFNQILQNKLLQMIKCSAAGFFVSTVPYKYSLSKTYGITTFKTQIGAPIISIPAGFTPYGRMSINGDIKNNKVYGIDNLVKNAETDAYFLTSYGLSEKDWRFTLLLTSGTLKFNIPILEISPGLLKLELTLEPAISAIMGANIKIEKDKPPLLFSARLGLVPAKLLVNTALTMEGQWKNPFGFDYLTFNDIAGELVWDISTKASAGATGEVAGDTVSAGASAGSSGAASSSSAPSNLIGGGFTFNIEVGKENDSVKKHLICAISGIKFTENILFLLKQIGSVGKQDLDKINDTIINLIPILQTSCEYFKKIVPLPHLKLAKAQERYLASRGTPQNRPPVKDRFGSTTIEANPSLILKQMLNVSLPSIPNTLTFEQALTNIKNFALNAKEKGNSLNKWMQTLPDMELINPEFRYAFENVRIGEINFERGITVRGTLNMLGKKAGNNLVLDLTGITNERFISKLDLGAIISPNFKNQITIDGAGLDGKYGTADDGPAEALNFNISKQGLIYTGKILIAPLECSAECEARVLKDELSFKGKFKPFNLFDIDLEVQGANQNIIINGALKADFISALTTKINSALNTLGLNELKKSLPNKTIFSIKSATFYYTSSMAQNNQTPRISISMKILDSEKSFDMNCDIRNLNLCAEKVGSQIYETLINQVKKTTEPTKPIKPTEPKEPAKPIEPAKPTEPTKPTEPSKPAEPTKQTEPTKPEEPAKPKEPTKPTEPAKPGEPPKPTEPVKPTEPKKPATTPKKQTF